MNASSNSILISGYGDIGRRVAQRWLTRGARVAAICRRPRDDTGLQFLHYDLDQPITGLDTFDVIYHFMPPPASGDSDTRLAHLLAAMTNSPKKMVLLSTSAVYGDCNGAWVDEQAPVQPSSARGKRRADAERQWQQWCERHVVDFVILRVPGIYGPGRLPIERIEKAVPMVEESAAPYTNRIHSEDLAEIAFIAADQDCLHGIYNVSDGEPGNMTQYFDAVADALGCPRPPKISLADAEQQLSSGLLSYLKESRRLSNEKLMRDSGYQLRYPTLAAGLAASLKN